MLQPNFVVVPLQDDPFNRCKSNIGWLEATYFGAVCLASCLPEFEKPGVVLVNDSDSLHAWFKDIDEDFTQRELLFYDSVQEIKKNYLLSRVNQQRAEALKTIWSL